MPGSKAAIRTGGDRRTLELPPSLEAQSERVPGPGKHSGRQRLSEARNGRNEKLAEVKREAGRRTVGWGGGTGLGEGLGEAGGNFSIWVTRGRGSALPGQKLPKRKSWRLNSLSAQGSQRGHIREKKRVSKDSPTPGPAPED